MSLPFFSPSDSPGPSFFDLARRQGVLPVATTDLSSLEIPHATTCVALRYRDGVVMAGDRRATSGNWISHRSMEKVVQADDFSGVAIAGAAGQVDAAGTSWARGIRSGATASKTPGICQSALFF